MKHLRTLIFIIFGVMLQQLVHTLVEMWYISLLLKDFSKYGFGFSWDAWFTIHHVGSLVLLVIGLWSGYEMNKKYEAYRRSKIK